MKLIDLHCDTILGCMNPEKPQKLKRNDLCVDLEKLRKGDSLAQFFAMFVDLDRYNPPMARCLQMIDCFYRELEENAADIAFAGSWTDIEKNSCAGQLSAILTVEEGGVLEGKLGNLRILHKLGVRLITLLWNYPNCIGYPNANWTHQQQGLTPFGVEVVEEMNRLGMLIDVSHLSDQGFWDVVHLSKAPFVASHSNAREILEHPRNLTDSMLVALADAGGVTGINLEPTFIGNGGAMENIIAHIKHIRNKAGIEVLAIGTDFDGTSPLTAITNTGEMNKLKEALQKNGFTTGDIEKVFYKNAERVIREVLR